MILPYLTLYHKPMPPVYALQPMQALKDNAQALAHAWICGSARLGHSPRRPRGALPLVLPLATREAALTILLTYVKILSGAPLPPALRTRR